MVYQELKFDPEIGLRKAIGDIQGAANISFEQIECTCVYGLCQELQQLDVTVEVEQFKLA